MKMTNYHVQNGCWNCLKSFCMAEWEEGDRYYCTFNAPPRPRCGSCFMKESFVEDIDNFDAHYKAWRDWSKDREVQAWGICNEYKINEKEEAKF